MTNLITILGRSLNATAAALDRFWRGMLVGLDRLARRLAELWQDAALAARDLGFKLTLTAVTLAKVLGLLSPGVAAVIVGFATSSLVLVLVGATLVGGLVLLAAKNAGGAERAREASDVYWMTFFRPSWRERGSFRALLEPPLRAWMTLEDALDTVIGVGPRHDPIQTLLRVLRRESRARMHGLRRFAARLAKRPGDSKAHRQAERTLHALELASDMVLELGDLVTSPDLQDDDFTPDDDAFDEVVRRLAATVDAFRELRR